jgi:rsbT co-antagonist protein RsbR
MHITQRQVGIGLFGLLTAASVAFAIASFAQSRIQLAQLGLASGLCFGALLFAYWRGLEWVRYLGIIAIGLFTVFGADELSVNEVVPLTSITPAIVAALLASPAWVFGAMVGFHLLMLIFRAGFTGIYATPTAIVVTIVIALGMVLIRLVTDSALRRAEANAAQARQSQLMAEQQAAELAEQTTLLRQKNEQQQQLIGLVATLETPTVSLANGVLLAPIVGHLDSRRAQMLTTRILQTVSEQRTRLVILDISGVATVDTQVAHALLKAIQAIRLLGCNVTLTGISAGVATTITHLGIALDGVSVARSPQEALAAALV